MRVDKNENRLLRTPRSRRRRYASALAATSVLLGATASQVAAIEIPGIGIPPIEIPGVTTTTTGTGTTGTTTSGTGTTGGGTTGTGTTGGGTTGTGTTGGGATGGTTTGTGTTGTTSTGTGTTGGTTTGTGKTGTGKTGGKRPTAKKPKPAKPKIVVLSNLKSVTHWAYPTDAGAAYSSPSKHSKAVGHLELLTGEGHAATYLELRSETIGGATWIEVPLPGRPNGKKGWVPAIDLGQPHILHSYIRIDLAAERLTLYRSGKQIFSAPVGTGDVGLGLLTPKGHFYVREKFPVIDDPAYGPLAMGTSAYAPHAIEGFGEGVVGIHGTNEPQLIPGDPSHGCVRLRNEDIVKLYRLVEVGTPIEIV